VAALRIFVANWRDIRHPEAGGAEVHLHEIFRRLAAGGHQVTLLASRFPGAAAEEMVDGIHTVRTGGREDFNFHVPVAWRRRFARERFDVVVDDINKIPFMTPLYVRRPILAQTHHFFRETVYREAPWPVASYVYTSERLVPWIYRGVRFATVSPSTRDELARWGIPPGRIAIIYNAVDHARYRPDPALRSPAPTITYLGRLKRYKRVDLVVRALPAILARVPEARLCMVGSGDFEPELRRLAADLGIAERVEFAGFVSEAEKIRHLAESWVVVNPSSKEGWGVTVIEANACGTPVVAARVPGLRDAVRDGESGILLDPANAATFAEAITRILEDRTLRARLTAGAIAWASRFTWDESARATESLLRRVIEDAAP